MIALGAAIAAMSVLLLCLVRLCFGPTLYDRVIAANAGGHCVALGLAALAVMRADGRALDIGIALMFAIVALNLAMFKFSYAKTFQSAIARAEDAL
jgi:multisubunit Na+/H+ antiporter MnhF subunit